MSGKDKGMDIEHRAILRLQEAAQMSQRLYNEPLLLTYSGGKDSDVLLHLAVKSGIDFQLAHSHTSVDMPETVYHVRDVFKRFEASGGNCEIVYPTYKGRLATMWSLIPQKRMPPTRLVRYCCSVLKEGVGRGRFIATGVRRAESSNRSSRGSFEIIGATKKQSVSAMDEIFMDDNSEKRRVFENCHLKSKRTVNAIIDWTDNDIWDYIDTEHIQVNPKYCDGYTRIGCIGCPMAGKKRWREFADYPVYQRHYITAFDKMLAARRAAGLSTQWERGVDVFHWWMEDGIMNGQTSLFEEEMK